MIDENKEIVLKQPVDKALTPQAPEVETKRKQALYDTYRSSGGIFEQDIYNTLISFTQEQLEARKATPETTAQALSQAGIAKRIANITLTPREIKWYEYLRESEKSKDQKKDGDDGTNPVHVSDQKILAEIFLIEGDKEKYNQYTESLPNIFKKPGETIENPQQVNNSQNVEPPEIGDEITAASMQFVQKLSGITKPPQANEAAFNQAVQKIAVVAEGLLKSLDIKPHPYYTEVKQAA